MKRNITSITLLYFIFTINVRAQVLEKSIAKFRSIYNLSYTLELKDKDFFSDSIFNEETKVAISLTDNKNYIFRVSGAGLEEIFDGNKLITFNLLDSTYRVLNGTKHSFYYSKLVSNIITKLEDDLKKHILINQQKDSTINGKSYYQLKITERDSIINNKRTYLFVTVLIDKMTYMLFSYRSDQQGFIDGTNIFLNLFSEYHFKDYKANRKNFPNLSSIQIPAYFLLEKSKTPLVLLAKGTKAPEIELFDSIGNIFKLENQKGKIVLLNFTGNGCPHSVESIEMLNKLYAKYNSSDFIIVTINPFDTRQSIKNNHIKFNVKYPTYSNPINGLGNVDSYHVEGYPTFYLLDKQGNIAKGFPGYYSALDEELVELINNLNKL